jgi:putative heme-binding domain-containing protein
VTGPDLSNLIHRDYASVDRDIHAPSAAINPDYIAHSVALADGRVLQGTLRTEGDRLLVGDTGGRQTAVDRADVEATSPSAVSIMPEGLDTALGPERLRDLLTFLLTDPLSPAKLEPDGAPPPRRRSELDAVLKGSVPVENPKRLRIVLSAGPKDHGPGEHDYPLWLTRWSALFATDPNVAVETADGWPSARQLEAADVVVFYSNNPGWDASKAEALDRYLARGGGIVLIHYAVDGHQDVDRLAGRIGLAWQGGTSAFRHGPLAIDFSGWKHPIARGFDTLRLVDESYWNLVGDPASVDVIGTGVEDGRPRPLFWTRRAGEGRVFVSIPGHFTWTFDDPLFRVLILRGMAWAAGEPIDRFNELTTLGARIGE